MNIKITTHDFKVPKPAIVRLLIAQIEWSENDWVKKDDLFFLKDASKACAKIEKVLSDARRSTVNMVLLPELSVPEQCIQLVQAWSNQTGTIVIAGSHYHKKVVAEKEVYIARSPIIIGGEIFFTEKILPAPIEVSPVKGLGLIEGNEVAVFKNTTAGNFGVLICSDFLNYEVKLALLQCDIDILCVPSFQRDSEKYHSHMNIDCEEHNHGIYIAYSNTKCGGTGDGRSALFAVVDRIYLSKLKENHLTDLQPRCKACEINNDQDHFIAEVDLNNKRPHIVHTVNTRPNIRIVPSLSVTDVQSSMFIEKIIHDDERYAKIKDLFVEPAEFHEIVNKLSKGKIIFVVGDPGIGKTYTAARLLRLYFDQGYEPIWYTGLEKSERAIQRHVLENLRPRDRQIIYFEDPFGRTTFERRDSLYHIFGPLVDHLKEVDARIIITSRREIFEQFTEESLTARELIKFTEEMNIIKPSYSAEALKSILHKLAQDRCKWYTVLELRELVCNEINKGRLKTPLSIRDFVFSTENVASKDILIDRMIKRDEEEKLNFSEEMLVCDIPAKIALSLIFLFGKQTQATLSKWFSGVAQYLEPSSVWGGMSPFLEEVRRQFGYRIEQYGYKGCALRFIHPKYEEAFAEISLRDTVTFDVLSSVLKYVARDNILISINAVLKNSLRYSELTIQLLSQIVPVIKNITDIRLLAQVGLKLISDFSKSQNAEELKIIRFTFQEDEIVKGINCEIEKLNYEGSIEKLIYSLRFLALYSMKCNVHTKLHISWDSLFQKLRKEPNFSRAVLIMEALLDINYLKTLDYLNRHFSENVLLSKFKMLNIVEQRRFVYVFRKGLRAHWLQKEMNADELLSYRERKGDWIIGKSPDHIGIVVDDGAIKAIKQRRNLLAAGIFDAMGDFERDELISIFDQCGNRIAAGISLYNAEDIQLIRGHHSNSIKGILGYKHGTPVVRASNIVFLSLQEGDSC